MLIKSPPAYDVSHWKSIPDFTKIAPKPYWMGTKASEGNYLTDDKFVPFFNGMAQIGCHRLAYHFHRKANTAKSQADKFVSVVKGHLTAKDTIALDVEEGGETAAQLREWIERVQNIYPDNLIMLYSRKNLLDPIRMLLSLSLARHSALDVLAMTETDREFFRKIPVWVAGYPNNPDTFTSIPAGYIPDQNKFGPVYAWQYSEKGVVPGIIGSVDLNLLSPLYVALLGDIPQPPPTGETMANYEGKVKALDPVDHKPITALSVRPQPNVNNTPSATKLTSGTIIKGDGLFPDNYGGTRTWMHITVPQTGYVAAEYLDYHEVVVTPPPADNAAVLAAIAAVKTDTAALLEAMTSLVGVHVNIVQTLNAIKADTTALLNSDTTPNPPPALSDGYTGPRLVGDGIYEVIDVPSDPINQQWGGVGSAVPLFDDNGGDRIQIKEVLYDHWMNTLEGFKELVDKGTVVTDETGKRFILGKAIKGQKLLIALQGKSDGVMRGQVVGFTNEDNPLVGAVNYQWCTPENSPHLFNKITNVRRWIPIMSGNKGNNWWIPMPWLRKVG